MNAGSDLFPRVTKVTTSRWNKPASVGVSTSMRIPSFLCAVSLLVAIAACNAAASDQPLRFSQAAEAFVPQTGSPLLFVGRIVEVNSGQVDCKVNNYRDVTYSVSTVLFGFAPSGQVKVAYQGCAKADAPRSYTGDVLVLAMFSGLEVGSSRKELVVPATPTNLRMAQSLLNADLKKKISRYMRHHGHPRNNRVVVFEGIVRDSVPHRQQPIPCKEQMLVPINYDVEQVLYGDWKDKQMLVHFGTCFYIPDPPLHAGQRMIVFAYVSRSRSQVYGELNLLFAPEQMPQVRAALGSSKKLPSYARTG